MRQELEAPDKIQEESGEEEANQEESENTLTSSDDYEDPEVAVDKKYIEENFPGFHKVNQIEPGGSFGEIALRKQVTRQATILCEIDTEIAVLSKENYQSILRQYQEETQAKKMKFLKLFSIFNCFDDLNRDLDTATYFFEPMMFKYNQAIYKEGENADYFYLLQEGQVEISRVALLKSDSSKGPSWIDREEELLRKGDYQAAIKCAFSDLNSIWKSERFHESNKRINEVIKAPCFFGESEILQRKEKREHRAIAKSISVKTLVIKRERLETDFLNKRNEFKKALINEFSKKTILSWNAKKSFVFVENYSNSFDFVGNHQGKLTHSGFKEKKKKETSLKDKRDLLDGRGQSSSNRLQA